MLVCNCNWQECVRKLSLHVIFLHETNTFLITSCNVQNNGIRSNSGLVDLDEALNEPRTKHRLGLGQSKDLQRSPQCSIAVAGDENCYSSYCNLLSYIIMYYIIGQWRKHDHTWPKKHVWSCLHSWDPNIWRAHPIHTSYHLWLTEEVACERLKKNENTRLNEHINETSTTKFGAALSPFMEAPPQWDGASTLFVTISHSSLGVWACERTVRTAQKVKATKLAGGQFLFLHISSQTGSNGSSGKCGKLQDVRRQEGRLAARIASVVVVVGWKLWNQPQKTHCLLENGDCYVSVMESGFMYLLRTQPCLIWFVWKDSLFSKCFHPIKIRVMWVL